MMRTIWKLYYLFLLDSPYFGFNLQKLIRAECVRQGNEVAIKLGITFSSFLYLWALCSE